MICLIFSTVLVIGIISYFVGFIIKLYVDNEKSDEYNYLNLLREIYNFGIEKSGRSGVTRSLIGNVMKFKLTKKDKLILPLLTTKNMTKSFEIILHELLFFIRGQTDNTILQQNDVKIWNANSALTNNDCGPIYGFQWRHFGANYVDCKSDYSNQGIDQLKEVINEIKNNPFSRRLIVSSWNPIDIPKMCLPPCHVMYQFIVEPGDNKNYLSCIIYQRSADMPLGVPFNIASYALLTHIVAKLTNLEPRELIHMSGDAHIYNNQLDLISTQLSRKPYEFPELEFNFGDDNEPDNIDNYKFEYISIKNYKHWPRIKYSFTV